MCDCSVKRENEDASEPGSPTILPLFGTCSTLPVQRSDYAKDSLLNIRPRKGAGEVKRLGPKALRTGPKGDGVCVVSVASSSDDGSSDDPETSSNDEPVNENDSECAAGCGIWGEGEDCICLEEKASKVSDLEHTLVIVKSESTEHLSELDRRILEEGFEVQQKKNLKLTSEQVAEFYTDDYGATDFTRFVSYMTSGPIVVQILARKDAIRKWQLLMGPPKEAEARLYFPDSLRGRCASSRDKNSYHGSADPREVKREIRFFFPGYILEPILEGQHAETYLRDGINDFLAEGLAACCIAKPLEPVLWLANWLLCHNPHVPKLIPTNHSK